MKKTNGFLSKILVKVSMAVLPFAASIFAVSLCTIKMYEPELPECLRKMDEN